MMCSEDSTHPAKSCCMCQIPPIPICDFHSSQHISDLHFLLPLSILEAKLTTVDYEHIQQRLWQTNNNYTCLVAKMRKIDSCEEEVERVCQIACQIVVKQWKQRFSELKNDFLAEMMKAIEEVRLHLAEPGWCAPEDSLARLLLCTDTTQLANMQLFKFKAECNQEQLRNFLQVALRFITSDLDRLSLLQEAPLSEQLAQLQTLLSIHEHYIGDLKSKLEGANKEIRHLNILLQQVEELEPVLDALRTDSKEYDRLCAKSKEEKLALHQQYQEQLSDLERKLKSSQKREDALDTRCANLWHSIQKAGEELLAPLEVDSDAHDESDKENDSMASVEETRPHSLTRESMEVSTAPCKRRRMSFTSGRSVNTSQHLNEDEHNDECFVCGDGGELLMCESCPRAAHLKCVNLSVRFKQNVPEDDWFCAGCKLRQKKSKHKDTRKVKGLRKVLDFKEEE